MLLSVLLHVSMRYLVTDENNSCANVVSSNEVIIHKPPSPPPIAQEGFNEHWKINKTSKKKKSVEPRKELIKYMSSSRVLYWIWCER